MSDEQRENTTRSLKPMICPQCEAAGLVARHCKTICPGCGYVESCEDNFVPNQQNPVEPYDNKQPEPRC